MLTRHNKRGQRVNKEKLIKGKSDMSKFLEIKRVVEQEKQKKMRAEVQLETLKEEEERLKKELEETFGSEFDSLESVEQHLEQLKTEISDKILEVEAILKDEDVLF